MLSKPYQDEFFYNDLNNSESVYDLTILPEINGDVIVVITALEENERISITNCYEGIATQIYFKHLKKTEINKIVWIEKIIHQTSGEAFFRVDLIWDEQSKIFHSLGWKPCDEEIIRSIKRHCEEYVG